MWASGAGGAAGGGAATGGSGGGRRPFFRRRKTCPFSGPNAPPRAPHGTPPALAPSPRARAAPAPPARGPERARDRLQGHEAALALHLRARQDRALAHHGGVRQEAA